MSNYLGMLGLFFPSGYPNRSHDAKPYSDVQRCILGPARLLPLAPPPPLTKRQRRRQRGKARGQRHA